MSVRQKPAKFVTSDGEEFDTQSAAERHEELLTAERECEHAKARYSRALWRTQRTADDHDFEPYSSHDYWFLVEFFGMPEIRQVSFWLHECKFNGNGAEIVYQPNGYTKPATFKIEELYWSKSEAERALLAALEKYRAEVVDARIDDLRERVDQSHILGRRSQGSGIDG